MWQISLSRIESFALRSSRPSRTTEFNLKKIVNSPRIDNGFRWQHWSFAIVSKLLDITHWWRPKEAAILTAKLRWTFISDPLTCPYDVCCLGEQYSAAFL
jgi:hypothetical protein